jgi:hypothetical protein
VIPINVLPDEVLLEIFDFWVDEDALIKEDIEAWQSLVHVCRRWRSVVFGSPRRLNLRLYCDPRTPVKDILDVWPPLPLVIRGSIIMIGDYVDNLITILELRDRVCQMGLYDVELPLEDVMEAMLEPFPGLTDLVLESIVTATVLPDSFLGGSAPRLRKLHLHGIPFPGLPKLLLSATHLVDLQIYNIPDSGYFSPEALVTALSSLTSLRLLTLEFRSFPNQASRRPPPTRSLLPVLNSLRFEGVSEYLDDLVARIDAPRLNNLVIIFFDQIILDTPQFTQFIRRTPTLEALEKAYVAFWRGGAAVKLSSQRSGYGEIKVKILCRELNRQVSSLEQFCTSYLPLSTSEDLYIYADRYPKEDAGNMPWLELLHAFTTVKNLYLSKQIAPHIAPALQELVEGITTGVLPILQNISFEGIQPREPVLEGIENFIAARQLSGQPITFSTVPLWIRGLMHWTSEFGGY